MAPLARRRECEKNLWPPENSMPTKNMQLLHRYIADCTMGTYILPIAPSVSYVLAPALTLLHKQLNLRLQY